MKNNFCQFQSAVQTAAKGFKQEVGSWRQTDLAGIEIRGVFWNSVFGVDTPGTRKLNVSCMSSLFAKQRETEVNF